MDVARGEGGGAGGSEGDGRGGRGGAGGVEEDGRGVGRGERGGEMRGLEDGTDGEERRRRAGRVLLRQVEGREGRREDGHAGVLQRGATARR